MTNTDDADLAIRAGADAIGLNFFAESPRFVSPDVALDVASSLPPGISRIGVFVNASTDMVRDAWRRYSLDYVQLHGDEPPAMLDELRELAVIRAFRCEDGLTSVVQFLSQCRTKPHAVLVDAFSRHSYGGTGRTVDWNSVAGDLPLPGNLPIILAGGLNAANVANAISIVRPTAVDAASGVEVAPGRKDSAALNAFVSSAKAAFGG